ncbi:DUF192 domain-containing protein [Candidatus Woesearchaeota archaeon]|nr:DUF192 domain-containing protein [Candidatus Woesearchaeota archaeon]
MQIRNLTRKTLLSENAKICKSALSKFIGLMFSRPRALVFAFKEEKIISLHMLFVFYPIDVLFLDKSKKVAEIKENFMPFSFYRPRNKAMYVIELPNGMIKKSGTRLGDKISF